MLRCADGRYYVGSTRKSREVRVAEHNSSVLKGFTSQRLPVFLVWSQEFADITAAISAERQIKGWRRAMKEALIAGDFEAIQMLASRAAR
jgi:putative endonuclease